MRYMGDVMVPGLDAMGRDTLLAQWRAGAPSMKDDDARDLLGVVDATPYGKRERMMRYGIGALAGLVAGYAVAKATR